MGGGLEVLRGVAAGTDLLLKTVKEVNYPRLSTTLVNRVVIVLLTSKSLVRGVLISG